MSFVLHAVKARAYLQISWPLSSETSLPHWGRRNTQHHDFTLNLFGPQSYLLDSNQQVTSSNGRNWNRNRLHTRRRLYVPSEQHGQPSALTCLALDFLQPRGRELNQKLGMTVDITTTHGLRKACLHESNGGMTARSTSDPDRASTGEQCLKEFGLIQGSALPVSRKSLSVYVEVSEEDSVTPPSLTAIQSTMDYARNLNTLWLPSWFGSWHLHHVFSDSERFWSSR